MFILFWERITTANPALEIGDQKMTLTTEQFRKQLKKAYDAGFTDGAKYATESGDKLVDRFMDIFKGK